MSNRMRHYLPDNFIFGPWMLISGFVCAFKIEIKVFHSALNLHLDYRGSSSKNAQKHLKGNLSELLQKWDPDTHFWYPSWYSDAQSPGGTPWLEGDALESALYCSSDTPDPRQLVPESWSSTPGCVIRAFSWGLPSCPPSKDTFLSNDLSWGTSLSNDCPGNLLSFQDGVYKEVETFPCTTKENKVWSFLLSSAKFTCGDQNSAHLVSSLSLSH